MQILSRIKVRKYTYLMNLSIYFKYELYCIVYNTLQMRPGYYEYVR